jgi:hypothetical protein
MSTLHGSAAASVTSWTLICTDTRSQFNAHRRPRLYRVMLPVGIFRVSPVMPQRAPVQPRGDALSGLSAVPLPMVRRTQPRWAGSLALPCDKPRLRVETAAAQARRHHIEQYAPDLCARPRSQRMSIMCVDCWEGARRRPHQHSSRPAAPSRSS